MKREALFCQGGSMGSFHFAISLLWHFAAEKSTFCFVYDRWYWGRLLFPVKEGALCQITRKTEELLLVLQTPCVIIIHLMYVCLATVHWGRPKEAKCTLNKGTTRHNCAVFMTRSHQPAWSRKAVPEPLAGTLKMTYLGRPRPMMVVPML